MYTCDEREIQNHNKHLLTMALKCLISLGSIFNKKSSGEIKEIEKVKSSFMAQGMKYHLNNIMKCQ